MYKILSLSILQMKSHSTKFWLLNFSLMLTLIISCDKTYEDGPAFSLRGKMNRITGKWKLVSIEGVDRLSPEKDQYMTLTKEKIGNYFVAEFENFQNDYTLGMSNGEGHKLFTCSGDWSFTNSTSWKTCGVSNEMLSEAEGIFLALEPGADTSSQVEFWKIKRLKHKTLIIENLECENEYYYDFTTGRTLTFEKVENL